MTDTKPRALSRAKALTLAEQAQRDLDKAEANASERAGKRDAALLAASDAGASRAQLEDRTGLSQARITQVLRRARATPGGMKSPTSWTTETRSPEHN